MKGADYDLLIPMHKFYHFACKVQHVKAIRASGGIGIFVNRSLCSGIHVFSSHELVAWIKLDCKFFNFDQDVYIACAYLPPEGSTYSAAGGNYFDILESEITKYSSSGNILLCGDLNARTGTYNDFITAIPSTDTGISRFANIPTFGAGNYNIAPRYSLDKTRPNKYGKELLKLCKTGNMLICNGRLGMDKGVGKLTCYTAHSKSVVDYLVSSYSSLQLIQNFQVESLRAESDHCLITFNLNTNCKRSTYEPQQGRSKIYYKWDPTRIPKHFEELTSDIACSKLAEFISLLTGDTTLLRRLVMVFIHTLYRQ